jgi:hypothetical protein
MRSGVRASLLVLLVASLTLVAVPSSAQRPHRPSARDLVDRALLAHTSLEPRLRGEALQRGAILRFDDAGVLRDAEADAVEVASTPGVTQNGVCLDARAEAQVGDTRTFWVHNFKLNMDLQKTFVLAAKAPHSYVWVDATQYDPTNTLPGPATTQTEAQAAAAAFESIYAIDREYFGEPARCDQLPIRQPPQMEELWGQPWYDADDDPHINIVNFDPDVGATVVAGYYSSADEYPVSANEHSNEGEFFYMNSLLFDPGTPTYNSILAHEFFHMIQFSNDANEETWVNEGMADVAIEVNGLASLTASHTDDYASNAGDQLTHWDGQLYDYGNAYSYLSYLLEHYGPVDDPATPFHENYALAEDITKADADGMAGLDAVLAANPYAGQLDPYYQGNTAHDVYLDRAVANLVNDRTIGAGQWGYGTLSSLRVNPHGEFTTYPQSGSVADAHVYGDRIFVFDSMGDGTFSVSASPTVAVVDNTPPSGTHELWSNRGDQMQTFAVREADLTGATAPHLRFSYWYDIEEDYDYAYLQVSTDGGTSWTNLACCGSRTSDPNGNNLGNGMTGISTATPLDLTPQYLDADVDLSAYAGRSVLIRFLYVTDPAVNDPGLTIDDVSLVDGGATIWPTATFETGNDGFTMGGTTATMAVVEPDAPNQLTLQLVKLGPTVTVDRPVASSDGTATLASGAMDAQRTIAIVSSFTPLTSEVFPFTYQAEASEISELAPPTLYDPGTSVRTKQVFSLRWSPAGNAGSAAPIGYRVQEATVATTHLAEDAESGLGAWVASTGGVGAIGWQTSQAKVHGGSSAFWASALEGAANASATLTLNQAVAVPTGARTRLSFWDWAINESDDRVVVEVSTDGSTWQPVYQSSRSELAPDAAAALATEPMTERVVDLTGYAGQSIRLRFRLVTGPDNRSGSTPFGWYLDDIALASDNWATIGQVAGTNLQLQKLQTGTFFYRVAAVYSAALEGPFSNVVDMTVVAAPKP